MNWKILNKPLGSVDYSPSSYHIDPVTLAILGISGISGIASYFSNRNTNQTNAQAVQANNAMNLQIARETNQTNKDIYQKQFQDQLSMWNKQNAYNDPSQEIARLRSAGLNPSLTFGEAAQAGSMTVPSASPAIGATMQAPQYSDILGSSVGSAINTALQMLSTYGSSSKDMAEAKGITIDNATRDQYNKTQLYQAMADIRQKMSTVKVDSAQYKYLEALEKKVGQEARFLEDSHDLSIENLTNQALQSKAAAHALEAQADQFAAEKAYKDSLTALNNEQLKVEPQRLKAVIDNLVADTSNKYAQAYQARELGKTQQSVRDLNQANTNKAKTERHESIARQYKMSLESAGIKNYNEVYEATKDFVIKEAEYSADLKLSQAELNRAQATDVKVGGWTFGSEYRDKMRNKYNN